MGRVLCENRGAGVPAGIKHVPHCQQPLWVWPYPKLRCTRLLLQSLARAVPCTAHPSAPAPTSCQGRTARVCLPNIVLWVRRTHQQPLGCSSKSSLHLRKCRARASPGLFPAITLFLGWLPWSHRPALAGKELVGLGTGTAVGDSVSWGNTRTLVFEGQVEVSLLPCTSSSAATLSAWLSPVAVLPVCAGCSSPGRRKQAQRNLCLN